MRLKASLLRSKAKVRAIIKELFRPEVSVARVPWTQLPGDIDNRREKGALTGTHRGHRTAALAAAAPAPAAPSSPSFSSCCRCGSSLLLSLSPSPHRRCSRRVGATSRGAARRECERGATGGAAAGSVPI